MAVGGGQAVAYAAGRWRKPRDIDSPLRVGLDTVSCVTASFCAAGDQSGNVFIYNGTSWSRGVSITSSELSQLSCGTTTACVALDGDGDAIYYNGSSWSQPQRTPDYPNVISCPTAGFCMAMVINESFRLSGGQWVEAGFIQPSEPQGGSEPNAASAVSCSGPHFCAALDDFGDAFTWAGSGWSPLHRFDSRLADGPDAVSCRARTSCMAVAGVFATRWNGTRWSPKQRIDRTAGELVGVSCPVARFCVAVDRRAHALIYR